MAKLNIKNLAELLAKAKPLEVPLNSSENLEYRLKEFEFSSNQINIQALNLGFSNESHYTLRLLNEHNFKKDSRTKLSFPSSINPGEAYLAHQIQSSFEASIGADVSGLGLDFKGDKTLSFTSFKKHHFEEDSTSVLKAALKDWKGSLWPFDEEKFAELAPGEAFLWALPGKLSLGLELDSAGLLSGLIHQFSQKLGTLSQRLSQGVFGIEMEAGASLNFSLNLEDDFKVLLKRKGATSYELEMFKSQTQSRNLKASLGLSIHLAQPEQLHQLIERTLEKIINPLEENLIEKPLEKIQSLLAKTGWEELKEEEKALIQELFQRLGFLEHLESLKDYREKWTELQTKVKSTFEEVLESELKAGFSYDYQRITSTESFLKIELNPNALRQEYWPILSFQSQKLLEKSRVPNSGLRLLDYYFEEKNQKKYSRGFGLGLGKWNIFKDLKTLSLSKVSRENAQGQVQVHYLGKTRVDTSVFGEKVSVLLDLNAHMPQMSPSREKAKASDFEYALSLGMNFEDKKVRQGDRQDLAKMIDQAILWEVLPEASREEWQERIWTKIHKSRDFRFQLELKFEPVFFSLFLSQAERLNAHFIGASLAASLAFSDDSLHRREIPRRVTAYTPYFQQLWQDPEFNKGTNEAMAQLDKLNLDDVLYAKWQNLDRKLAQLERSSSLSLHNQVKKSVHLFHNLRVFIEDCKSLEKARQNGQVADPMIQKLYKSLLHLAQGQMNANNSLSLRVLGRLLIDFARHNQQLHHVHRSLRVSYEQNEGPKEWLIASSS